MSETVTDDGGLKLGLVIQGKDESQTLVLRLEVSKDGENWAWTTRPTLFYRFFRLISPAAKTPLIQGIVIPSGDPPAEGWHLEFSSNGERWQPIITGDYIGVAQGARFWRARHVETNFVLKG